MANYEIVVRQSVLKDLENLPRQEVRRVTAAIRALAADPRPPQSKKLSGEEKYRLRVGDLRVLYEIQDRQLIVTVVKVRHRKDAYRK